MILSDGLEAYGSPVIQRFMIAMHFYRLRCIGKNKLLNIAFSSAEGLTAASGFIGSLQKRHSCPARKELIRIV